MGERRALVIGARNDRFGVLDFVEDVARELHRTLLDSERGACLPALPDGRDLLVEDMASSDRIDSALADSIAAAAADQATLFVYFLGHGKQENQDFYLIGTDTGARVDSRTAVQIGQRIKELLADGATVDGLMLVLDACHSGAAITDPVPGLLRAGVHARLEIFAATREDQTASNACFTRSITALLTRGSPEAADEYLTAYEEHARLRKAAPPDCSDMPAAVHVSISGGPDAGLWLGRNRAADLRPALRGTGDAAQVARLTRGLVRTRYLTRIMELRWSGRSPIAITGPAGAGKSVLLAALGRISVAGNFGVDALAAVRPGDSLASVGERLAEQLQTSVIYRDAAAQWTAQTPVALQETASTFDSVVTGPIGQIREGDRLLIGVDGVDQLGTLDRRRLLEAFVDTPMATLIVTGRTVPDMAADATVELPMTDQDSVGLLLEHLIDDDRARARIAAICGGEWLLARILAGLWRSGHFETLPADARLDQVFAAAIVAARESSTVVDDVLIVLATAPPGAWMPLELLTSALAPENKQVEHVHVRDALVALGELVSRADPGTDLERVGPAHELIAAHLTAIAEPDHLVKAHGRVADALRAAQGGTPSPALAAYAQQRLSDHLWNAGRSAEALEAIPELETPADTLALWELWGQRVLEVGPEHPDTLATRQNIAYWAQEAGDTDRALTEFATLLPDQVRVLGAEHPATLATRSNIAMMIGRRGDARGALKQLSTVLPDVMRVLGPDNPTTLNIRSNIASVTGQAGDPAGALQQLNAVLPDLTRVLGPQHGWVLSARLNSAVFTGKTGDPEGALEQLEGLLRDQVRILGPDDPATLTTRNNQARWTLETGAVYNALTLYRKLLPDRLRVLGPDHFYTLVTRAGIAQTLAEIGNVKRAIKEYRALLEDQKRVLGPDHPETLAARHNLAVSTARAGDTRGAIGQLTVVLEDRIRVLGPDHPDTRVTHRVLDRMLAQSVTPAAQEGTQPRSPGPPGTKMPKRAKDVKRTRRKRRR